MNNVTLLSILFVVASPAQVPTPHAPRQRDFTTAQIAKKVSPCVVVIKSSTDSGEVLGSGFIVSNDGKVVTNLHVILGSKAVAIQMATGEIYDSVSVLASDERRDLVVLRIPGFNLPVLELGDSDSVTTGQPLAILGSPRGLEGTVTAGILSAVRDSGEGFKILQTDAAVNPGNSGGPLLNNRGQAIGVVSFKLRSAENLNFAIPINYVRGMLATLHEPLPLAQMRTQLLQPTTMQHSGGPQKSEIFAELPQGEVRSILKGMGFEFTESQSDKVFTFRFQLSGYKVTLFDFGTSIQLQLKFSDSIDPVRANEWNRQYRYSRAYSDEDGGAVIEADLDFDGGVTRATVEEFIKTFRLLLDPWVRFVASSATTSKPSQSISIHVKSSSATKRLPTPFGKFAMWIDPEKWTTVESQETGVLTFENRSGDGYAKIITEKSSLPNDVLKGAVLGRMRKTDPNAEIVLEESRNVNGHTVLVLRIDATVQRVAVSYYGYFHGGTSGTIQVLTYTTKSLFDESSAGFTEFLNGLEIMDDDLTSAAAPQR